MRVLYFLFLLVFVAALGAFAYFNGGPLQVRYFDWAVSTNLSVVAIAAYVLGMLSGWTVVGMLRKSINRVAEPLYRQPPRNA